MRCCCRRPTGQSTDSCWPGTALTACHDCNRRKKAADQSADSTPLGMPRTGRTQLPPVRRPASPRARGICMLWLPGRRVHRKRTLGCLPLAGFGLISDTSQRDDRRLGADRHLLLSLKGLFGVLPGMPWTGPSVFGPPSASQAQVVGSGDHNPIVCRWQGPAWRYRPASAPVVAGWSLHKGLWDADVIAARLHGRRAWGEAQSEAIRAHRASAAWASALRPPRSAPFG